jgi:hypothetical protein
MAYDRLIVFDETIKKEQKKRSRSSDGVDDHLAAGAKGIIVLR